MNVRKAPAYPEQVTDTLQRSKALHAVQPEPEMKPVHAPRFTEHIWNNRRNRKYLLWACAINTLVFLLYKYFYPFPDFSADSHSYVFAAVTDARAYYRPFGYSRFLQLLHSFAESHYALVAFQYAVLSIAGLFSFFSVDYLYSFHSSRIKFLSWLLTVVNPCTIVLANLVLADPLFIALSVIWFTLLLWIVKTGKWWCLLLQFVFLYWSFHLRYNALYYPAIIGVVFLFTRMKLPYRLCGIAGSFLVICNSYINIKSTTYERTGTEVFSGFSGWQMANNALLIYKETNTATDEFEKPELQLLDKFVKRFIDSIDVSSKKELATKNPSSVFLWDKKGPLRLFATFSAIQNKTNYFQSWYAVSPLYQEYGWHIISKHPAAFLKGYMLPNLAWYIIPPYEIVERYNISRQALPQETKKWLRINRDRLPEENPALQQIIMYPYPVLHALLLVFCLIVPALYLWKNHKAQRLRLPAVWMPVLLWYLFLLADLAFSTFAAVMTLRYALILFIIGFGLPFYFLDRFLYLHREQKTA
jgi:hypothetical protein